MKKDNNIFLPTNCNYTIKSGKTQGNLITLEEIKQLNFWNFIIASGGEEIKKKSSKYGKFFKFNGDLWVRYDYNTLKYFYVNLSDAKNDKGTLIDFIQLHILKEKNLGKVRKYVSNNLHLF